DCYLVRHLGGRRSLPFLLASGPVVLLLIVILGSGVLSKVDELGLTDAGRAATWRSTLHMIGEHPWTGTGLGTFPWAFPAYRGAGTSVAGICDRAHSTPLETAAELGVPVAVLIAIVWMLALGLLARGIMIRRRDHSILIAALFVALLALLHTSLD